MSREQFFKPNKQEEPEIAEAAIPEKLADWETIKAQHLAAKEEFHKARMAVHQTGKDRYIKNKFKKQIKDPDKPSA